MKEGEYIVPYFTIDFISIMLVVIFIITYQKLQLFFILCFGLNV